MRNLYRGIEMKKSYIPNLFTFINLSLGTFSLLSTFSGKYLLAAIFICIAALVDRYDGKIARFLNLSSELGKELDSLSDLVSFGVAPGILLYIQCNLFMLGPHGLIGSLILLCYIISGAYRLARYNLSNFDGIYSGIPITITGSILAILSLIALKHNMMPIISVLMPIFSYFMISNIKLKKV